MDRPYNEVQIKATSEIQDMKTEKSILPSRLDEIPLRVMRCMPDDGIQVKGIVQIAHGMCEHKERFIPFMEYLCRKGYLCVIHDHRGHGESVKSQGDLGYFHTGGWKGIVDDILIVNEYIRSHNPGLPIFLFGHSMGSLAVRSFTKRYDTLINGLIVCGSPSRNPATGAGRMLARLIASIKGDRHRPSLIHKMAFESFNSRFVSEGENAWLSTDRTIVKEYNNDPLCGYMFTVNGFTGLFDLMLDTYSDKGWNVGNPSLPIHFIAGADDPCITSRKDFDKAVGHIRSVGYAKVTSKLYEGMRHEILNETDRMKVWNDVLETLDSWAE